MPALLIGCGNSREKKIFLDGDAEWHEPLVTIDMDPDCGADMVMDLGTLGRGTRLPFPDQHFDEIGAYDVLEHWGQQGDWRAWFREMAEYHRILKPGGSMGILVPVEGDALADPGHTRFFGANHFWMLSQRWYAEQLAAGKQVSDYRWFYRCDFEVLHLTELREPGGRAHHMDTRDYHYRVLAVVLREAKRARVALPSPQSVSPGPQAGPPKRLRAAQDEPTRS
jgi:SAM-dependent methyltransferase